MEGLEIGKLLGGLLKQVTDEVQELRAFQAEAVQRLTYLEQQDARSKHIIDDLRAMNAKTRRGLLRTEEKVIEDKTTRRVVQKFYRKWSGFTDRVREQKQRIANRGVVMQTVFLETRKGMLAKYYPRWAMWHTQRRRMRRRLRECLSISDDSETALRQIYFMRLLRHRERCQVKRAVAEQMVQRTLGGVRRRCWAALHTYRAMRKRQRTQLHNCAFLSRFSTKGLLREYVRKLQKFAVLNKAARRTRVALANRTGDLLRRNRNILRKDYYRKWLALQTSARAEAQKRKQRTLVATRFCCQSEKVFKVVVFRKWLAFLERCRAAKARRAAQLQEVAAMEVRSFTIRRCDTYRRMQRCAVLRRDARLQRHKELQGVASLLNMTTTQVRRATFKTLQRFVEHKRVQRANKEKEERRQRVHRGALQVVMQATDKGVLAHAYKQWLTMHRLAKKRDLKDEFLNVRLEIRKAQQAFEYEMLATTDRFREVLQQEKVAIEESIDPVRFSLAETQRLVVGLSDQAKAMANEHQLIREENRSGLTDAMGEVDEVLSTLKTDIKKLSTNSQHMLNTFRVEVDDSVAEQLQKLEFTMADLLAKDRTSMKEGFERSFEALNTKVGGLNSQVDVSLKSLSNTNMVLNKVVDRMISVDNTLEDLTQGTATRGVVYAPGPDTNPAAKQVSPPRGATRSPAPASAVRLGSPKRNVFMTNVPAATPTPPVAAGTPNHFSATRRT